MPGGNVSVEMYRLMELFCGVKVMFWNKDSEISTSLMIRKEDRMRLI